MIPFPRPALAALAAASLLACGREPRSSWTGSIDTLPTGAVVVENPATGIWDSASGWRLTEELVIRSRDNDPAATLSDIAALEVDSAGRIYLLDRQQAKVLLYDSAGTLIKTFGQDGDGPGEFRRPNGLGWDSAGRLWVVEGPSMRYSIFDREGNFVSTRYRPTNSWGYAWSGKFLHDGRLLELISRPDGNHTVPLISRYDSARGMVDSLDLPLVYSADNTFRFDHGSQGYSVMMIPFHPAPWSWIDPRGSVWVGNTGRYELTELNLKGDTLRVIRKPLQPVFVTAAERDSVIEMVGKVAQGAPFDAGRIPSTKPVLERMLVDDEGNIFVLPVEPAGATGTGFDVFDPEGRYLGRLTTSRRIGPWRSVAPVVMRRGKVWAVVVDQDDVPGVVRWRMEKP